MCVYTAGVTICVGCHTLPNRLPLDELLMNACAPPYTDITHLLSEIKGRADAVRRHLIYMCISAAVADGFYASGENAVVKRIATELAVDHKIVKRLELCCLQVRVCVCACVRACI
jgi:hypothetical protein